MLRSSPDQVGARQCGMVEGTGTDTVAPHLSNVRPPGVRALDGIYSHSRLHPGRARWAVVFDAADHHPAPVRVQLGPGDVLRGKVDVVAKRNPDVVEDRLGALPLRHEVSDLVDLGPGGDGLWSEAQTDQSTLSADPGRGTADTPASIKCLVQFRCAVIAVAVAVRRIL